MDQNILEIFLRDIKKEKEFFNGLMIKYMMDNGKKEKNMGVECGKAKMVIVILVNGKKVKFRALEFLLI